MKDTAKRIVALMIALMLAVPALALAEEIAPEEAAVVEVLADAEPAEEIIGGEVESAPEASQADELEGELFDFIEADVEEEAAEANAAEEIAEANATVELDNSLTTLAANTYTASESMTIDHRLTLSGNAVIDLAADKVVTINGGINVPSGKTLTIQGSGKLIANNPGDSNAAIGGNANAAAGSIVIAGGEVEATASKLAAGIGGSTGQPGGTITISGGTVTATGADGGAGIGGGATGGAGTIRISGGSITAIGGTTGGAGIGTGNVATGGTIEISGGTITATGGTGAAGIGGGIAGNANTITISSNATIEKAQGGSNGAGIGCGYGKTSAGTVKITGGTVNLAQGGENGAGIGSGASGSGNCTVEITNGNVTAKGGANGAGIGAGKFADGGSTKITGGTVTAFGGENGAGIGGGDNTDDQDVGNGGTINIEGGTVTATGGDKAAGIGGGNNGHGGTINIKGTSTKVTAQGTVGGAGIGGGISGNAGKITVSAGTVNATGGAGGAGIGGGSAARSYAGGSVITISGGTVIATGAAGIGGGTEHKGTGDKVVITGGTVTSTNGIGTGNAAEADSAGITVEISGGTVDAGAYLGNDDSGLDTVVLKYAKATDKISVTATSFAGKVSLKNPFQNKEGNKVFPAKDEADDAYLLNMSRQELVPTNAHKITITQNSTTAGTVVVESAPLGGADGTYWALKSDTITLKVQNVAEGYHLTSLSGTGVTISPAVTAQVFDYVFAMPDRDVAINASFNQEDKTVTFKVGSTVVDTKTVIHGTTVARTDKKLNGKELCDTWYTNAGLTLEYDFGEDVTTNLTLFGKEKIVRTATVSLEGWTYGEVAKTPVVTVKEGTNTVTVGNEDITYEYKLKSASSYAKDSTTVPINAGTYTVRATVKATATTTAAVAETNFTIAPKPVTVVWSNEALTYNGKAQAPGCTITTSGEKGLVVNSNHDENPVEGRDYTSTEYKDYHPIKAIISGTQTAAGTGYTATVTGFDSANYTLDKTAEKTKSFSIAQKNVDSATIIVSPTVVSYDGSAKTPSVTVLDGNTTIPASEYTVVYADNTDIGQATVTVKNKAGGNYYVIDYLAHFTITAQKVDTPTIELSQTSFEYDGTEKKPTVTVKIDGTVVPAGAYTVTYSDNVNVGTATVIVRSNGTGNYTFGATTATFTITPRQAQVTLTLSETTYEYDGTEKKPSVTARDGDTIVPATEYDVTYKDNVNAGTATVTAASKAGSAYSFTATATFSITARPVSAEAVKTEISTNAEGKLVLTVTVDGAVVSTQTIDTTNAVDDGQVKITPSDDGQGNITLTIAPGDKASFSFPAITATVPAAPIGTNLSKLTPGSKRVTATWTAVTGVDGYQIQYGLTKAKAEAMAKPKTVAGASKAKLVIKKLKKGKRYYFRIRTYKNGADGNPASFSAWSAWKRSKKVK